MLSRGSFLSHSFAVIASILVLTAGSCSARDDGNTSDKPTAAFTFSPASPTPGQTVQFTDTSAGSPTSWQWDFGDGATSTSQNPSHAFSQMATYSVSLTVRNGFGSDSVSRSVTAVDATTIIPPNRLAEWSSAGVPGGVAQYRPGGANARPQGVNVLNYGAVSGGVVNCTTAFANAQAACPAGSSIYIPDGTYLISGHITLKSNVTWRGQSPTGTIIKLSGGGVFETEAQSSYVSAQVGLTVTSGATAGSRVLTVSGLTDSAGHTVTAGRMVQLTDLTPAYMHANTANGWSAAGWVGYDATRLATIMFMVTSVNSGARTVTLDHALPIDMTASPRLILWTVQPTVGVGFESLTFDCTSSTSDRAVGIYNANACWFYGCYFKNIYDRSVWFQEVTNCTFEHCYSDNGQQLGRNCEALDFVENSCWCLVQDNIFHSAGYPMVLFSDWMGGCCGNVVGYNFQDAFDQMLDPDAVGPLTMDDNHGVPTIFNLWEGNYCEILGSDGYWGSSAYGTFFRNRIYGTCNKIPYPDECAIELTHWSAYYTVVGNVLGTAQGSSWSTSGTGLYSQIYEASGSSVQPPQIYRLGYPDMGSRSFNGSGANPSNSNAYDTNVKDTLIRHGNFDTVNNAVVWDPAKSNHVLPASLYLTSTPAWFGALGLPAIGPDVTGYAQDIPASARWAAFKASGNVAVLF
jgi:PKD repeat protein